MIKNKKAQKFSKIFRPPMKKSNRSAMDCLDKNESAFSAFECVDDLFSDLDIARLNLYPDPYNTYEKLAKFHKVNIDNLLITHGSEQAIQYVFYSFLDDGDTVVFPNPSYAMYNVYAQIINANVRYLDYSEEMRLDLEYILGSIDDSVSLFVLANPDNHTGSSFVLDDIVKICEKTCATNTIFLLDEAYFYYIDIDTISLLEKYENLIITRSCSKACGLAGARIGYVISNQEIIDLLRVHKPMHEMNSLNNIVFNRFLDNPKTIIDKNVKQVEKWKNIFQGISNETIKFIPTSANFLIFKFAEELVFEKIKNRFLKTNIAVRFDFTHPAMRNCLRFSVGKENVMEEVYKIINIYQNGWFEKETVNFYLNGRSSYEELYESEKYFLTKEFIEKQKSVLDIGCATGGLYKIISNINPVIKYTGIDISQKSIEAATEKYKNANAKFILYSGILPFPIEEKFDLVYCSGLLHLIDNWKDVLRNMVMLANNFVLFDLRVSKKNNYSGKYFFDFENNGNKENFTNYNIINYKYVIRLLSEFSMISKVEIFGYEGKPNKTTFGIDGEIYMLFFKCHISTLPKEKLELSYANETIKRYFGDE